MTPLSAVWVIISLSKTTHELLILIILIRYFKKLQFKDQYEAGTAMRRRMTLGAHNLPAGGLHHTHRQTPTEGNPEQVAPEKT